MSDQPIEKAAEATEPQGHDDERATGGAADSGLPGSGGDSQYGNDTGFAEQAETAATADGAEDDR